MQRGPGFDAVLFESDRTKRTASNAGLIICIAIDASAYGNYRIQEHAAYVSVLQTSDN
jgi:hypothetical protein